MMSGLKALQNYASSSSESDDEDHVTQESPKKSPKDSEQTCQTASTQHQHQQQQNANCPALPSLPPEILGMFGESAKAHGVGGQKEDPSMHHEGRVRSFEHVPGNWATYVYIPVDLTEQLQTTMEDLLSTTPSSVDMKPVSDLHISISRTVTLQYQWIDPFVDSMCQRLASVDGFTYCFQEIEFYVNDEKTRSFIGLKVGYGHEEMLKLVEIIDICLQEFSLPVYYKDPSFHVSFGWCLGDYRQVLSTSAISTIQKKFERLCKNDLLPISVSEIWCKAGCKQFRIPLAR